MLLRATPAEAPANRSALALEQAVAALRAGDPALAERTLRARLLEDPGDSHALAKLAELLRDRGRPGQAIHLFRRALTAAPDLAEARLALARLLHQQGQPQSALDELERLPASFRSSAPVAALEAALLGLLGRHEPEIALYRRLVAAAPASPPLWMSLGNALKYAGRSDEAVAALRRSVELRPGYGEGWWSLANVKTARFAEADLAAMRKALRSGPSPEDALHLHFALGKALEERGRFEQSFRHYDQGNRIRAAAFAPGQTRVTALVDNAVAALDPALFAAAAGAGHPARDPIFVIGLQRSGSTLVEQILASHPLIEGTTELLAMQQIWMELAEGAAAAGRSIWQELRLLGGERLQAIGADYLDRTRPFRLTDRPFFVDKLPANWLHVGLIRLALPNATIVDARRHPMACGFSNFKQHYATGVSFAYSLESIGRFYADYLRLMRHMDGVQPGAIHHLLNERLIDDPQGEVRRLLDFVGVPFDPACLDFHRNKRAVNTPSAEQVRRPINRDGVDAWRSFEPWLGPLKDALGPALDAWDDLPV
ncbi:MAG TPA: sulfotransferase [Sphingomicrobium sp.]|nr:sulfotransferase [Sphingomicrobium sp.]